MPTQDEVRGAFSRLGELAVDAVIVIMEVHLLDAATLTLPPHVQVVVVDSDAGDRYTVVDTDQAGGTRDAVRHLLDLGPPDTVWHLAGPEGRSPPSAAPTPGARRSPRRAAPCRRWCAATGRRSPATAPASNSPNEPDCTAVFAANDQMALGLLRALHERGRQVPDDVSVIGFDDIPEAGSFLPPLTTVHQDFAEVGRRCVEGVLRRCARATGTRDHARADPAGAAGEHGAAAGGRELTRTPSCRPSPPRVRAAQSPEAPVEQEERRLMDTPDPLTDEELAEIEELSVPPRPAPGTYANSTTTSP